jgi:hypothetical protein
MEVLNERNKDLFRDAGKTVIFMIVSLLTDPTWDQCLKNEIVADSCHCDEPNQTLETPCYGCTNSTVVGEDDDMTCLATANSSCVCGFWFGRYLPIYLCAIGGFLVHLYFRNSGRNDPSERLIDDILDRDYSREAWQLYFHPLVCLVAIFDLSEILAAWALATYLYPVRCICSDYDPMISGIVPIAIVVSILELTAINQLLAMERLFKKDWRGAFIALIRVDLFFHRLSQLFLQGFLGGLFLLGMIFALAFPCCWCFCYAKCSLRTSQKGQAPIQNA